MAENELAALDAWIKSEVDRLRAENELFRNCLIRASRLYAERQPGGPMVFPDGAEAMVAAVAEVETLRAERDRLRALVEQVEWVAEMPDYGGWILACPWCHHSKAFGHRDCPRQAALR